MLPKESALLAADKRILVLLGGALVLFPTDARLIQVDSHRDAVHDVLLQAVTGKKESGKKNVLTAGLWVDEATGAWPTIAVNTERSKTWELLHAHVVTDIFRFLLLRTTVMVPTEEGRGFLQICGPPYKAKSRESRIFCSPHYCRAPSWPLSRK